MSLFSAKKFYWGVVFLLLILIDGFFLSVFLQGKTGTTGNFKELESIQNKELNFKEYSKFFTELAQKKGAEYAYQALGVAVIPPGTDMHLLGHIVGEVLYKQEGLKGIYKCTQDFRNACSHSIVVGLFFDKGEEALPEIAEACRQAPGGSGAYTMCFHGLGHGVLAYFDYDLKKAVQMCQKTGSRESTECIGGAIMEMIGGGFHDRNAWERQNKIYFRKDDVLYPCSADFIPKEDKGICYIYLTPHLFQAAGADLASPTPLHFEKAFTFCGKIQDQPDRGACYGGFGKEFVVLAKQRDIRNINEMTVEELKRVYDWCLLAKDRSGSSACVLSALSSLFWGGENDSSVSINFCGVIDDPGHKLECFDGLINQEFYFVKDADRIKYFCGQLPDPYKNKCQTRIGE